MLLAVDVGNTHTVLGLFEGSELRADWRIPTRRDTTVDELGVLFRALFRDAGLADLRLQGMIVSSVVPGLDEVLGRAWSSSGSTPSGEPGSDRDADPVRQPRRCVRPHVPHWRHDAVRAPVIVRLRDATPSTW